jgi:hypothetical protein
MVKASTPTRIRRRHRVPMSELATMAAPMIQVLGPTAIPTWSRKPQSASTTFATAATANASSPPTTCVTTAARANRAEPIRRSNGAAARKTRTVVVR